jgi:hypothetical protein
LDEGKHAARSDAQTANGFAREFIPAKLTFGLVIVPVLVD